MHRGPDWLVLHDISAQGRVLLSRNSIRVNVACQLPGKTSEHDLGWLAGSFAIALSADGQTLIFSDPMTGRTHAGNLTLFRRSTDGSPAVALGEARGGGAISPDGRWVLAEQKANLSLLPVGAGSTVTLPSGNVGVRRRRRVARRLEAHCVHRRHWRREDPWLPSGDSGGHSACDHAGWRGSRRQGGGARRQVHSRSSRYHVDALSGSGRRRSTSSSAHVWGYPASMERRRQTPIYRRKSFGGRPDRRRCISRGACDWRPGFVENPLTGRPRGRPSVERVPWLSPRTLSLNCYSYMRRLGDLFVVDGLR